MNDRYDRAVSLLEDLYALANQASKDAFKNGVTDCSGTTDEGDVRAGTILGEVRQFLLEDEKQPIFTVGETIFYLRENRIHSAPVLSRRIINVRADIKPHAEEQDCLFSHFGPEGITYFTCHGEVEQREAFESRDALADSLRKP